MGVVASAHWILTRAIQVLPMFSQEQRVTTDTSTDNMCMLNTTSPFAVAKFCHGRFGKLLGSKGSDIVFATVHKLSSYKRSQ